MPWLNESSSPEEITRFLSTATSEDILGLTDSISSIVSNHLQAPIRASGESLCINTLHVSRKLTRAEIAYAVWLDHETERHFDGLVEYGLLA